MPWREMNDLRIIARPSDGAPVVLAPTAAVIWSCLEAWCSTSDLDQHLEALYPDIDEQERLDVRSQVVDMLRAEGLVESR